MWVRMRATRTAMLQGRLRLLQRGRCYDLPRPLVNYCVAAGLAERPVEPPLTEGYEMMQLYPPRRLVRLSPPASEPLSVEETKLFLRVDGTGEDAVIARMIAAAREAAEAYLRVALVSQHWQLAFDGYAPVCVALPYSPVQRVSAVRVLDAAGQASTVDAAAYHVNAANTQLVFDQQVSGHRVEIDYVAGYGDAAADVPAAIRQGLLHHVAAMFEEREAAADLPRAAERLYVPYREVRV